MNASDGHPLIGDAFLAARPLRKEGPVKVMRTSGCAAQHLGMLFSTHRPSAAPIAPLGLCVTAA